MTITVYAAAMTTPRRHRIDISPANLTDARVVLAHAVDRANATAAIMQEHCLTEWHGDTLTVAVADPSRVFADPECQDLARKIARRPGTGVRLLVLFTAADFVAKKKGDEPTAELARTFDCPPPLRAGACACPTLRASVLLGVIAAEVDGVPLALGRAAS